MVLGTPGPAAPDGRDTDLPSPANPPRRRHWLNRRRLKAYPWLFLAAFALIAGAWVLRSDLGLDVEGKPLGYDFVSFWSASSLALEGQAAASYQPERILEAGRRAIPDLETRYIWSYPPTFHLVVLPLGLLPFMWGYLLWFLVWLIPFLAVIRKLAPAPETLMLALAFPGTLLNLAQGQNGLMIAALFGGAMLLLDRRPILAGILIGLMSCKPQFGLLIPIALVFGRRWVAFAAAAVTTLAFAAVSLLAFGAEDWLAFFANLEFATAVLEDGRLPWAKMPSLFAALRLIGTPVDWAYAAQGAVALVAAVAVALVWWRRVPLPLAAAVLTSGALLVSPHVNDHDLALLAVPIALIAWHAQQVGWLRGEREILAIAWLAPVITAIIAEPTRLQVGFLCLLALFALAVKRALGAPSSQAAG
ncbi:MAG: glycosyltransferase family 87 protein [Kiloniellales bacterium]|nr:glycosyltransferase family 87 protein [Kiloniellales bacterium]